MTQYTVQLLSVGHEFLICSSKRSWLYDTRNSSIDWYNPKWYWSRYLVVCMFDSVCLITCKYIRPLRILNVLPYMRVKYVLLYFHNLDGISRMGCSYHTRTPWSGHTTSHCHGLVSTSCAREEIHEVDLPNWGALVLWVLELPHRLLGEWALRQGMVVYALNSDNVKVVAEVGIQE